MSHVLNKRRVQVVTFVFYWCKKNPPHIQYYDFTLSRSLNYSWINALSETSHTHLFCVDKGTWTRSQSSRNFHSVLLMVRRHRAIVRCATYHFDVRKTCRSGSKVPEFINQTIFQPHIHKTHELRASQTGKGLHWVNLAYVSLRNTSLKHWIINNKSLQAVRENMWRLFLEFPPWTWLGVKTVTAVL